MECAIQQIAFPRSTHFDKLRFTSRKPDLALDLSLCVGIFRIPIEIFCTIVGQPDSGELEPGR
jgi:hypothetical protein